MSVYLFGGLLNVTKALQICMTEVKVPTTEIVYVNQGNHPRYQLDYNSSMLILFPFSGSHE